MKPLLIKLRNIGPFVNEEIDFSKLENMFLITGNTGAGKTFIFDAMTFALYGSVCGSRGEESIQLRSKYTDVKDDSDAYVEFSFDVGGTIYRVNRTLAYKYVNKNNKEATKDSVVILEQYDIEKKSFIAFDEQKSQIDARIQSIIGLKKDEFSKIILLPQGAFSSFLKENSKDKAETLKKLFPVESYTQIMENVKDKAKELKQEIDAINNQIESLCQKYDFSEGDDLVKELKLKKDEIIKKQELNSKELQDFAKIITKLQEEKEQSLEKVNHSKILNDLLSKKEYFKNIEDKIIKAEKASVFGEFIRNTEVCKKNYDKAEIDFKSSKEKFEVAVKNYKEIFNQEKQFLSMKEDCKKNQGEKIVLEEQLENAKELSIYIEKTKNEKEKLEELKDNLIRIESEIEKIKQENNATSDIDSVIEKITVEISDLKIKVKDDEQKVQDYENLQNIIHELENQKNKLNELNSIKENLLQNIKNNKTLLEETILKQKDFDKTNAAFNLAKELKDGEKCPVCGSLDHPKLACGISELDFSTQISTYENNLELSQEKLRSVESEIVSVDTLIAEKSNQKEKIELVQIEKNILQVYENDKKILSDKETLLVDYKDVKGKLDKLEFQYEEQKNLFIEQDKIYNSYYATQKEKEKVSLKGSSVEELTVKYESIKKYVNDLEEKINKWEEDFKKTSSEKSSCEADFSAKEIYFEEAKKNLQLANNILTEKVYSSSFNDLNEVLNSFVHEDELVKLKNQLNEYKLSITEHSAILEKYKNIRNLSEIEEELVIKHKQQEAKNLVYESLKEDFQKIIEEYTNFESAFEQYKVLEANRLKNEKIRLPYEKLSNDLNGNNPKKLQFDSWVLGIYFEQVISFASKRFYDISNGRYNFKIAEYENGGKGNSKKGLDLLVIDSFTGSERPTSTLSGGETFMASISLALALTDVVQNRSGGIQLDSLFIDEGFGTLDNETLDKAIGVLNELQETKMVGIISHVDSLQSVIPSIIKVEKTQYGSHIKIKE